MRTGADRIPTRTGTYVLLLKNKAQARFHSGGLGLHDFSRGWYLYIGSAFGPGGLAARVGRHLKPEKSCRWHIDYLTARLSVDRIWLTTHSRKTECAWADILARMDGIPAVKGFGASDCACEAHLFRFRTLPSLHLFRQLASVPVQVIVTG